MAKSFRHRRPTVESLEPRALLAAAPAAAGDVTVVARHLFYNHSALDGRSARADAQDDAAIATDKAALLPGEAISAANYTTYSRGINGVMVDLAGLPADATLKADDFDFRIGNDADPSAWKEAPRPRALALRPSGDVMRVTVVWRDRSIRNTWLRVTLLANADTALAEPDLFYFGNLVGDADQAGGVSAARVDAGDVTRVTTALSPTPSDAAADLDHNGRVNRADVRAARHNAGAELYTAAPFPAPEPAPAPDTGVQPPALPGTWQLTFHDEFADGPLGAVWHAAQYWDHAVTVVGQGELEAYDATGVSVGGGMLHLTARKKAAHGVPYTSGLVMTGGERARPSTPRFSFRYGYLEVRAKIPAGRGLWPAVWMMPASFNDDNGELDVIEVLGGEPSHAQFAAHRNHEDEVQGWDGPDLSRDFHTYAIDWQADHVSWYIDGVERARTTRADVICKEAMYVILNLAVGGAAGTPGGNTTFPATMDVDYVRVWQGGDTG